MPTKAESYALLLVAERCLFKIQIQILLKTVGLFRDDPSMAWPVVIQILFQIPLVGLYARMMANLL